MYDPPVRRPHFRRSSECHWHVTRRVDSAKNMLPRTRRPPATPARQHDDTIDLVRGLSAVVFLLGHLRALLFSDFNTLVAPSAVTKAFYLVTSLHHPAVMVFFVLSGYFVGGSVMTSVAAGNFCWSRYALARLTRLWVVLLPTLALTRLMDAAGSCCYAPAYEGGLHHLFNSGPSPGQPTDHSPVTAMGNVLFLQTICVPTFGSNVPLWSLANEAWYYLLFALLAVAITPASRVGPTAPTCAVRLSMASAVASLAYMLPWPMVSLGSVWLMGVAVWWASNQGSVLTASNTVWWKAGGCALFLSSLVAAKYGHWLGGDHMIGVFFAVWMLSLLGPWSGTGWLKRFSRVLAAISYTLYLTHFPVLFLVVSGSLRGRQFSPSAAGYGVFIALATFAVAFAGAFWWLFERNTDRIRQSLASALARQRATR